MAVFSVCIDAIAVSAAVDLFEIVTSATRDVIIHELYLDMKTPAVTGRLGVSIINGYTTSGSGGSTVTPRETDGDTGTFGGTSPIEILNTTPASAGTALLKRALIWNLASGLLWLPTPEDRLQIPQSTRCVVRLVDAPSAAMTVSATLVFEE